MTLKAFLFLLVVTIVAVTGAALIAEALLPPGFERGIVIAVLSGLVVFPAARWAEYRGWIKGAWSPGGERRTEQEARKAQNALAAASPGEPATKPVTDPEAKRTTDAVTKPITDSATKPPNESATDGTAGPQPLPTAPDGLASARTEAPQRAPGQGPSVVPAGDFKHPGDPR